MAGFEVIIYGRFWVITEVFATAGERKVLSTSSRGSWKRLVSNSLALLPSDIAALAAGNSADFSDAVQRIFVAQSARTGFFAHSMIKIYTNGYRMTNLDCR
jgi:hypothetical protein